MENQAMPAAMTTLPAVGKDKALGVMRSLGCSNATRQHFVAAKWIPPAAHLRACQLGTRQRIESVCNPTEKLTAPDPAKRMAAFHPGCRVWYLAPGNKSNRG